MASPNPTAKKVGEPKKPADAAASPARAAAPKKARRARPATAFEPVAIPARKPGKSEDPRLAAALAARERWHGRSGRPALKSATQAIAFARERRLVHPHASSAIPNLVDPVIGRSCSKEERFGGPPSAVLGGWAKEIGAAADLTQLRLCFEQPTLVQVELWPSVVAIAAPREDAARAGGILTGEAAEALEFVDRKGMIPTERMRAMLGLTVKDFGRILAELEARLCVITRPDLDEEDVPITVVEPLSRWASRTLPGRRPDVPQAWTLLFAAAVRAAVVVSPEEAAAIFPWSAFEREQAIATALAAGAAVTYTDGPGISYVASPVPR